MQTGQINVTAENIFPIIKKFLYSDQEIFLRELIANAVDATQKLKSLASIGEFEGDFGDLQVEVVVDKQNKTVTIKDNGIGMTAEEVEKYINQIAFSSAEEFLDKYKDKGDVSNIIGKFGLGFYSAFLVADKVEIFTKSYSTTEEIKAVHWECDGTPKYKIEEYDRQERGTNVVLHISEDSLEYADETKISELLDKYCKFLPVPIKMGTYTSKKKDENDEEIEEIKDKIVNNINPAWKKAPSNLEKADYIRFYKELYPNANDPLFWIHLNVDYPFNLTGVLYFPQLTKDFQIQKDRIKLFCNQVYVTDQLEGVVPNWLVMLEGVIDSPDIPLNVSRSFLQSDGNVKKIGNYITKKIAEKLNDEFKKDREAFEKQWDTIKLIIEYGMIWDDKFMEKAKEFFLFKNIEGEFFTLDEYMVKVQANQTDKNEKLIYIYTTDPEQQHSFIQGAKKRDYDVLLMDGAVEVKFMDKLERKLEKTKFVRVDSETPDKLVEIDKMTESKLTEDEQEKLKTLIEENVDKQKFTVRLENMEVSDHPMVITKAEHHRRMGQLSGLQMGFYQGFGVNQLTVNVNHPLMKKILKSKDQTKLYIEHCVDSAQLIQGMLKGEELTAFVDRNFDLFNS